MFDIIDGLSYLRRRNALNLLASWAKSVDAINKKDLDRLMPWASDNGSQPWHGWAIQATKTPCRQVWDNNRGISSAGLHAREIAISGISGWMTYRHYTSKRI